MLPEVPHPFSAPNSWGENITAPRTIGSDDQVEAWYFAEHFLDTYVDWRDLLDRWSRYFGQSESPVMRSSERLNHRCRRHFVNGVSHSSGLRQRLRQAWTERLQSFRQPLTLTQDRVGDALNETNDADYATNFVESVVHEIIRCDRHVRVAALIESQSDQASGGLLGIAREMDSVAAGLLDQASSVAREELQFYLQEYRHSMLRLSWLEEPPGNSAFGSTLYRATKEHAASMSWLQKFTDDLMRDEAVSNLDLQLLNRVLNRIADAIGELGYDCFAEDISSRDFVGGDDSPVGSSHINLIPSRQKGACHAVLLAVSRGASRSAPTGFPKIMRGVKTHLIDCTGVTRVVIVLCDQWDSKGFMDEHFEELRAHYRRGVRFLFLLAGAPSRNVATVPVDFEATSR
jgi:hypothetical protein